MRRRIRHFIVAALLGVLGLPSAECFAAGSEKAAAGSKSPAAAGAPLAPSGGASSAAASESAVTSAAAVQPTNTSSPADAAAESANNSSPSAAPAASPTQPPTAPGTEKAPGPDMAPAARSAAASGDAAAPAGAAAARPAEAPAAVSLATPVPNPPEQDIWLQRLDEHRARFHLFDYQETSFKWVSLLGRYARTTAPVFVERSEAQGGNHYVWYHAPTTFGAQFTEYGPGPVTFLFNLFFAAATTSYTKVGETDTHEIYRREPGVNLSGAPVASSTFSVDWSDTYKSFRISRMFSQAMGLTLGTATYSEFGFDPYKAWPDNDATRQICAEGCSDMPDTPNAFLFLVHFRAPFNIPYLGGVTATWDIPSMYLVMGPLVFLGAMDEGGKMIGYKYLGGVPKMHLSARRTLGPLEVGAEVAVPTAFLAVPWYLQGTEYMLTFGLGI